MKEENFYDGWNIDCETPQGRTYFVVKAYDPLNNKTISVDVRSSCPGNCAGCKAVAKTKIKDYLISPINHVPEIGQQEPNELENSVAQP